METALKIIMKHEGLRLRAYRCAAGVQTIGYGHTGDVAPGMVITEQQARDLLAADLAALRRQLDELCQRAGNIRLTPNREAALLSFAFNVGFNAFSRSTLWRKVIGNPDDPAIAAEFARWKYAGGKVQAGLVKRRAEEAALYFAQ